MRREVHEWSRLDLHMLALTRAEACAVPTGASAHRSEGKRRKAAYRNMRDASPEAHICSACLLEWRPFSDFCSLSLSSLCMRMYICVNVCVCFLCAASKFIFVRLFLSLY